MRGAAALVVVLSLGFPVAAHAGVDVNPSKVRPRLFIEAESEREHQDWDRLDVNGPNPVVDRDPVDRFCVEDDSGIIQCYVRGPGADPDDPELTEGEILRAVREIGLPSLQVQIQPGTSTLVNVPTIFYTQPEAFDRSVTLLGFDVDLIATPVRFRWLHGDGTAATTSKPGKPYPSPEVTHRYRQPSEAVSPRVDVTYRVKYRVDGGSWNTIEQTLLASGPTAELEVKEAAPVLTHP